MEEIEDFSEVSDFKFNEIKITYSLRKRENPLLLGQEFLIGDFLGEGVSAKVYEALDLRTLERRALKLYEIRRIFKSHNYDERVEMLKTEIKLLTRLEHKHLIKYFDVYTNQKQCTHPRDISIYAIMEYCIGCVDDLMEAYDDKRLPVNRAQKYFRHLMRAVEYLHSQGVIHKDIKTANMLIDLADNIKLTDLGVCEVVDQFTEFPMCNKTSGSFIYQSPEMFDLEKQEFAGNAVDVWACGITLYFMLTGKYPFEGKLLDLMEKICHENIQLPTYLQHERHLFDLLNRMLQKNASERATVGQVLQHVWVSRDVDQELTLNHPCAVIGTVYRGLLPRTAIEHWTNVTSPIELAKGCLVLIRHTFDVWKSELNGRVDMVRPKPRTRYEDVYRSMSITPYLHQLHYPVEDARNRTEISEDEVDEFEQLRRIALVRSNRRRRFKSRYRQKHKLYAKFCHIMGFGKNELDT